MANITSNRGTYTPAVNETSTVRDVASRIAQLQPDAAPLITFMSSMKRKKSAHAAKFEWLEDDLVGITVADGSGAGTGTTLTVSAADGLKIRNGDILMSPNGENSLVTAGGGGTSITLVRTIGTTPTVDTLVSGDQLVIIGNAYEEGGTTGQYRSAEKVPKSNYIQIFKDPVKITHTLDATDLYGGNDRVFQRKKVGIEHKRGIETQFLFGTAYESSATATAAKGGYMRTTKGLSNFISTNVTATGGTFTEAEFETFLRGLFRYGANTKVALLSPIYISAINFWAKQALQVRSEEKLYGMKIATYRSGHGDLEIVKHWLLGDFTNTTGLGLYFDPANVGYRFLQGLDTKLHVDIAPKTEEYFLDEYRSHVGFQCELEKTHGKTTGCTGFAA